VERQGSSINCLPNHLPANENQTGRKKKTKELSLQRIEMTRSSGKASNKSHFPAISGDFLFLLRQGMWSPAEQ
jgi:hypothetical protein